jgi:hypothetical protein
MGRGRRAKKKNSDCRYCKPVDAEIYFFHIRSSYLP